MDLYTTRNTSCTPLIPATLHFVAAYVALGLFILVVLIQLSFLQVLLLNRRATMTQAQDVAEIFIKNRLDKPLKPVVGSNHSRNVPFIKSDLAPYALGSPCRRARRFRSRRCLLLSERNHSGRRIPGKRAQESPRSAERKRGQNNSCSTSFVR
jgi:hypothetical protein